MVSVKSLTFKRDIGHDILRLAWAMGRSPCSPEAECWSHTLLLSCMS